MSYAILTDTTRCTGCEKCVDACAEVNHLGEDVHYPWVEADGLSGDRFCSVVRRDPDRFVRLQCRHCLEPACAAVCPVGALKVTERGAVVYDRAICMGCRYCMMACPYGIPRYEWEEAIPYISKCTLCAEAMARGEIEQPACTAACPEQATVFFTSREEALEEARRRIAESPGRYFEDRIWGEHEVGGTRVLYLSDIDLTWMSLNDRPLPTEPLPHRTHRILATVPPTFIGVGLLMTGTWLYAKRRRDVEATEGHPEAVERPTQTEDEGGEA